MTIRLTTFFLLILNTLNLLANTPTQHFCQPGDACWPSANEWQQLGENLGNRLIKPQETLKPCQSDVTSTSCQKAFKAIKNPFILQSNPADLQSQGWLDAWQNTNVPYAVLASSAKDVSTAVKFAKKHNLRLAIKGAGHDYLGRNMAKDALLIWLIPIKKLKYQPNFIPVNAPKGTKGQKAIDVGAGERWLNVYNEVTNQQKRYVQGGGCASVGATGGFTQGGGFGSWSKKFGTGAAGVLQFEMVDADGQIIIANPYQNADIFWAVRGGGGGTFGIITEMTLLTHPLPKYFALVRGEIHASSDKAYQDLVRHFLVFFKNQLNNEHWGENISFKGNKIEWFLLSQGLSKKEIKNSWQPLKMLQQEHPGQYQMAQTITMIKPSKMWDYHYMKAILPELVVKNNASSTNPQEYWWQPNSAEVSTFWYTYQSWWIPENLFSKNNLDKTAKTFADVSKIQPFAFHIQKGLSGASEDAISRTKETSTHPGVFKATGLVIMSAGTDKYYPSLDKNKLDIKAAREKVKTINQMMAKIIELAPDAGTYANEADYFLENWPQNFWGRNYPKLLSIKKKIDSSNRFTCHHCVGSE